MLHLKSLGPIERNMQNKQLGIKMSASLPIQAEEEDLVHFPISNRFNTESQKCNFPLEGQSQASPFMAQGNQPTCMLPIVSCGTK